MRFVLLVLTLLFGCGADPEAPRPDSRIPELQRADAKIKNEALSLRDAENGWLTPTDCDGMLWTGKYASVTGVSGVDIRAAEYPERGRFGRRPMTDPCTSIKPEWSSFSGDMGKGLVSVALHTGDLTLIQDHADYGNSHNWQMGKPFGDGRALYKPGMIGLVMSAVYTLGGPDSIERHYVNVYPSNAKDYEAHLVVLDIYLRWKAGALVTPGDVDTLVHYALLEPHNPFYQAVLAIFTGNFKAAITLLLDPAMPVGEYVRCDVYRTCQIAEWLYAANIVLNHVPAE